MNSWRGFVESVHVTALGLWLGMIVGAASAAAVIFPTMKTIDARIPGYEASVADNFRVAGGMVAQKVFLISDLVAFPSAIAAIVTLGVQIVVFRIPVRRPATILRAASLSIALAAFASMLIIVEPALVRASKLHWAAIKAGDSAAIALHKAAVDELHPMASNLMAATALAVLCSLIASVWALAVPWNKEAAASATPRYPEPALLRAGKRL